MILAMHQGSHMAGPPREHEAQCHARVLAFVRRYSERRCTERDFYRRLIEPRPRDRYSLVGFCWMVGLTWFG